MYGKRESADFIDKTLNENRENPKLRIGVVHK